MAMFALMTMTPAATLPSAPALEEEIVVIASKLKDWRASLVESRGDVRCFTQRSTGDAAIDRIGCQSMMQCHARYKDRFAGFKDHRIASNKRKAMYKSFMKDEFSPCVFERREAMIADLADVRAAAR